MFGLIIFRYRSVKEQYFRRLNYRNLYQNLYSYSLQLAEILILTNNN